jgi:hypothetical protein
MSEIPPIGLPNLVSQGDLVARARAAMAGSERAGNDAVAHELQRLAELRAEQVQRTERLAATKRQRREQQREDPHSRYDQGDELADGDDGESDHVLDVTA